MKFSLNNNQIRLDNDPGMNEITIDGQVYQLEELSADAGPGKGGNSCVFRAIPEAPEFPPFVIKFCRYPKDNRNFQKRLKRFRHEIDALFKAKESEHKERIVEIIVQGEMQVPTYRQNESVTLLYYLMESADDDLATFLKDNEVSVQQKVSIIQELMVCLYGLHAIALYHSDLKPDNILLFQGKWKIGDLGLIEDGERSYSLDGPYEKIGPAGYLSPEAVNKAYGDHSRMPLLSEIVLESESDVFQLGLIFWYMMQGEIPVGCVNHSDFIHLDERWFHNLIQPMLQFRRDRRAKIADLINWISSLETAPIE